MEKYVPLEQIAKISYAAEEGKVWRRDLKPTITVRANVIDGVTGNDATAEILASLENLQKDLPAGYSIKPDGALESSAKSMNFMLVPIPAMIIIVIITLLMFQLKRMSLMFITLMTAPPLASAWACCSRGSRWALLLSWASWLWVE